MNRNETTRFNNNPVSLDISRSIFDLDHKVLLSGNIGNVIPIDICEVLPGDTLEVTTSKVLRMQPMVTPIFDNLYADFYHFFVPTRLIWAHFKEFMGENTQTAWIPSVTYTVPQITVPSGGFDVGTIADYLGVPPKMGAGKTISALPFRAYAQVMLDWFYDQNLQNPVHVHVDDTTRTGVNTGDQTTDIELGGKPFIAGKYRDYFTSCLPSAQKAAGPTVEFALNGLLPVNAYKNHYSFDVNATVPDFGTMTFKNINSSNVATNFTQNADIAVGTTGFLHTDASVAGSFSTEVVSPNNLFADLNNTSIFDINSLRQAFAIQRYYERSARSGSRYIEVIKAFFDVDCPDYRVQRSEYLGGNRVSLNVQSCEQTSATQVGLTPQGNLTGISATGDVHNDFVKSFTEHGYVLTVMCVRYFHTYQQSIEPHWLRKTNFDYYNPVFANLGEQAVPRECIYFDAPRGETFGFQEAWADYRYRPNRTAGEMRSQATTPLDSWHLGDYYSSKPYLSDSWIREDLTNVDRCLAVTSAVSNQFMADIWIECKATRPMPLYSIPGLIDHH